VLLMVPTSVLWAAAQIRAFGQVVSAVSDVEVSLAISVAAVFVVIYTVAGGLLADVVTDFVQSIAVIVGLVLLLVAIGDAHGGFTGVAALIDPARLGLFSLENTTPLEMLEAWAVPICGSLLAVEMLSRIMGCRTAETARNATLIGAGVYSPWASFRDDRPRRSALGTRARGARAAHRHPRRTAPLDLPLYLVCGALISAILSTVDSCLLAAGSLTSHNLVVPLLPQLSERARFAAPHRRHRLRRCGLRHRAIRRGHLRARGHGLGVWQRRHLRRRDVRALQPRRRAGKRVRGPGGWNGRLGRRHAARLAHALHRGAGRRPRRLLTRRTGETNRSRLTPVSDFAVRFGDSLHRLGGSLE